MMKWVVSLGIYCTYLITLYYLYFITEILNFYYFYIDVSKGGGEESSSSSELSPGGARKQFPPTRKGKSKAQSVSKRPVKSSSGYSSHTEETTFR